LNKIGAFLAKTKAFWSAAITVQGIENHAYGPQRSIAIDLKLASNTAIYMLAG
jgi:hypothetical protein